MRLFPLVACVVFVGWFPVVNAAGKSDELASSFRTPPDSAKPWTYWFWINGNVTKEGIHKDLEEFKRQGINGILIFQLGGGGTPAGAQFLSPAWHDLFQYALREAKRLGMEVDVNLCDGWNSGGPWITPDHANKKLVYSEFQVDGRRKLSQTLAKPPVVDGYYKDFAVVAFRDKPGRPLTPAKVMASSSLAGYDGIEWNFPPQDAADGDPASYWSSDKRPSQAEWLSFEYSEPLAATGIYLMPAGDNGPRECVLQSSDDGITFSTIRRFPLAQTAETDRFPGGAKQTLPDVFPPSYGEPVRIAEAWLLRKGDEPDLRPGNKWWWFKSGNRSFWDYPRQGPAALAEEYPENGAPDCRASEIVDLSARMDANGRIEWNVPAGRWTILRFGYTLEGQRVRWGSEGGRDGYEADMLGSAGIECHFRNTAEPLLADAAAVGGKLKYLHIDS